MSYPSSSPDADPLAASAASEESAQARIEADEIVTAADQSRRDAADQILSDADHTRTGADRTASDADEAAHEADLEAAGGDQDASARDLAASGRDHAHGDAVADDEPAALRRHSDEAEREAAALARTRMATQRDETARLDDVRAIARDHATDARDRAAEREEATLDYGAMPDATMLLMRAATARLRTQAASDRSLAAADRASAADDRAQAREDRGIATHERAYAAADRAMAAGDRARAAEDRTRAAEARLRAGDDRTRAADDREQARRDLHDAYLDDLTGVYTRGFGLLKPQQEVERAHQSGSSFVLAFVDVDGLKQINDHRGHAGGDEVLRTVGAELKRHLRADDPIVRIGCDEFLCAFTDTALDAAGARMKTITTHLIDGQEEASISSGLAQLRPSEQLEHLIARGDAELYRIKHRQ